METTLPPLGAQLAAHITRQASTQTFYTIRLLADRDRVEDAYRAYAYFRWVDDELDAERGAHAGSSEFVQRQKSLLESCYRGDSMQAGDAHEELLIDLVQHTGARKDGLQIYLHNLMAVMAFDATRRGRLISQPELNAYTWYLASAVTEALHYFIGHDCFSPQDGSRYMAVSGAHVTHMLRDSLDDVKAGYYNIPREVLDEYHLSASDVDTDAYRAWVKSRVNLARGYFEAGCRYLRRVRSARCRLACFAYVSRFTGVLDAIEGDGYRLRASYAETKGLRALLRACTAVFAGFTDRRKDYLASGNVSADEAPLGGR
ncbi:MAG: squalene/phytoene synthase family protein [Bacteroidota bacterium]